MNIILLIRNADAVLSAITGANRFLHCRRQRMADPHEGGEVLGIWLKSNLDEGLPPVHFGDDPFQPDIWSDSRRGWTDCAPNPAEAPVGLEWSFTHAGLWSLCWMDGLHLRGTLGSEERRRKILDALLSPGFAPRSSRKASLFFPVFGASEAIGSIEATMRNLQDDYPRLISGTWFFDDLERGIVSPQWVEA